MKHSLSIPLSVIFLTFFPALSFAKDSNTKEQDKTQAHIETLKDLNQFRAIKKIKADPDMPDWVIYAMKARIALGLEDYEAANKWLGKAREPFQGELSDDVDSILSPLSFKILRGKGLYDDYQREALKFGRRHYGIDELPTSAKTLLEIAQFQSQYPQNVRLPPQNFTIKNEGLTSQQDPRIFLTGSIHNREQKFLLDTGAFGTRINRSNVEELPIIRSDISQPTYRYNNSEITARPAVVTEIKLESSSFINTPVYITPDETYRKDEYDNYNLLGLAEIQKLRGIEFLIDNGSLTGFKVINPTKLDVDEFEHNIFKEFEGLYIRVVIEDEVYECKFDTGAVTSHFNKSIYNRHKKSLKLKKTKGKHLNKKPANRSYLIPAINSATYIAEFPIYAGGQELNLQRVQLHNDDELNSNCYIGIDAIYEAGGGRLDLVNYDIQLGPN